jgi:hypothetical protein
MLTRIDQLPLELDRIRFRAELYDAGRRADAGLPFALILPLVVADGTKTHCLIADERAHAARTRCQQRPRRLRSGRDDWYDEDFAYYQDDSEGGGAA